MNLRDALDALKGRNIDAVRRESAYMLEGDPPSEQYGIESPVSDDALFFIATRRPRFAPLRIEVLHWYKDYQTEKHRAKLGRREQTQDVDAIGLDAVEGWVRTGQRPTP